jgi:hypothetical protein
MPTKSLKKLKSPFAKSPRFITFPVEDFASVTQIRLKPNDVCPYKNICCYNRRPDHCYGSFERNNEFICDLEKLRLMYRNLEEL